MAESLIFWEIVLSIISVIMIYGITRDAIDIIRKKTSSGFDTGEFIKECIYTYIILGIVIWIHTGYPYAFIYIVWIINFFKTSHAWLV